MTQEDAIQQLKEIERWTKAPSRTQVWYRSKKGGKWVKIDWPIWRGSLIYVIDDPFAELRKAQYDGKQLQFYCSDENRWCDQPLEEIHFKCSTPSEWRIKPEVDYPIYLRSTIYPYVIVELIDEKTETIVMAEERSFIGKGWECLRLEDKDYEIIKTVKINGQIFYDTQPVWAWDRGALVRYISFVDAKYWYLFTSSGERDDWMDDLVPDYVEPVKPEHIEDWMIEAWQKLKI